ncbi:alpha/beta fold hydrolase [Nocardioides sp.]|uniref:alpha/beta fold hydrolase n=1 Tax=Nocardioides sp. TaxID=35761 RepID=UPI0035279F25
MEQNPEIGASVQAAGLETNYHRAGEPSAVPPALLLHGSGPGVSAWANWRLNLPALGERLEVFAPDLVGFGFTERPADAAYGLDRWRTHLVEFADALGLERFSLVGNSFGGALALSIATTMPERVHRLVLMGSVGVPFELTPGLDAVWGYQPSLEAMRGLLDLFAHDRSLVTDELAELRYAASVRPGFQESFAAMFPEPRQRWVDAMTVPDEAIRALPHPTLVLHGREDRVIPMSNALRLLELVPHAQCHLFGECGHWTQIEHAATFNRLVGDFLTRP